MHANESESLLRYYNEEMTYLRRMGRIFAERYPKIAGRLELSADHCADPQVERMIQSFAILTARLQRRLDGEFPEITSALLASLYPNLTDPVPAMAIARFEVDPAQCKLTTGHPVPARTPLFAQTAGGLACRFQTCYPVTLWPLQVSYAGFEAPAQFQFLDSAVDVASVLRLRVDALGGTLGDLNLKRLRFCLDGEPTLVHALYEMLFCHVRGVAILPEGAKRPVELPEGSILPVGFGPGEEVIPGPPNGLPAYRLLQEYFLFPDKFLFFDLDRLDLHKSRKTLDILILLDRLPQGRTAVDRQTFCLGCTPVVNLFPRTSEPIRLDRRQLEYRLDPDARRERTTEVHSILSLSSSSNPEEKAAELEPFYSFRHGADKQPQSFWHSRRVPSQGGLAGTDILLSFVDRAFQPGIPPAQAVYGHLLCTNRGLAPELPAGTPLQAEESAPPARIGCLRKPTPPAYPPMAGQTLWSLISNLSLNHLPLADGPGGIDALREILRLYSLSDQPSVYQQVQGIRRMSCRRVTRRLGTEPWRGFCQGTEVELTFDESQYVGSGAFLLGAVLNQFLPLCASINSFTQLAIRSEQREGEWKRWHPLAGYRELV
jgi:type VI secretion system protein ImpG